MIQLIVATLLPMLVAETDEICDVLTTVMLEAFDECAVPSSSCHTATTEYDPSAACAVFHSALHEPDVIAAPTGAPLTRN